MNLNLKKVDFFCYKMFFLVLRVDAIALFLIKKCQSSCDLCCQKDISFKLVLIMC